MISASNNAINKRICECRVNLACSSVVSHQPKPFPKIPKLVCFFYLKFHPIRHSIIICMMQLYSRVQAPGLSSLSLDLKRRSAMHSFCSMFVCGKITILWFKKSLILKLHSSPGEILKKQKVAQKNTTWKIIFLLLLWLLHHSMGEV
jgi:hypothetical protein